MRGIFSAFMGIICVLFLAASAGATVDLTGGKRLKLLDKDGTDKDMAKARFVKDAAITAPLPDPTTEASRVKISSDDGNTGWFDLNMSLWAPAGTTGYRYRDREGAVQKVVLRTKNGLGKLIVKLKGDAYGAVALQGPEDWVEVRLDIGTTMYCGRFEVGTSEVKKNETGKVILKGPSLPCLLPAPTSTPTATATTTLTRTATSIATAAVTPTPWPCEQSGYKCVFLTSIQSNGNLGGLTGADATCQARADARALGGTWKAWLSDSNTDAKDRITDAQYIRLDGTLVANGLADLTDGTINAPINLTETNAVLTDNSFRSWTGTKSDGTRQDSARLCGDWTTTNTPPGVQGRHGDYTATNSTWSDYLFQNCSDAGNRLYCFEQ